MIEEDMVKDILEEAEDQVEGMEDMVEEDDNGPEPMDEDDIQNVARDAVTDAIDFIESEISEDRIKAQRYFEGKVDIGHEEGRSAIVATKVRDTIRNIKPSLMRVFLSNDKYVQFIPRSPQEVQQAETATQYIHNQFTQKNGYKVISDAFHDALLKKTGVVKVYWDDYTESENYTLTNLTEAEMMLIVQDENVEVLEQSMEMTVSIDEFGTEVQTPVYSLRVAHYKKGGKLCVESVPPEEFFVSRSARSIEDAYCVGHRTEMRVSDLVAMGYDYDEVSKLSGIRDYDTMAEAEDFERRGYDQVEEEDILDPSMQLVAVTECYMKMDIDGTGIAQMHRIVMGGGEYKLLDYEPVNEVPFAVFECDPEPHAFFGRSIADLIIEDQDASTAILRGILDNIAMTNNPRITMVEGQVNIDDLLNNEIGGVVRTKQPGAVAELSVPFVAGQTLGALQYYDSVIEQKTGVSRASMGLDPDALQNSTATAAKLTVNAAAGQIEVIARNFAEGGMTRLFKLMLKALVENSPEDQMMQISGDQFVPIDPRSWNTDMSLAVNVGLGTGKEDEKIAVLQSALQTQMSIWQSYGPQNGLVGMTNIRNTLADILAVGGIKNADRYYMPMDPQREQQLLQQAQQMAAQNQQPDPNAALAQAQIQAEQIKAQSKAQSDMLKAQLDAQKALAADDRERDKMDQELLIKAAEVIGKYGTAVDVERIKAMQAEPRYADVAPTEAIPQSRF
jgi:hypothetical protein